MAEIKQEEMVKPFNIDYEEANKRQQASMVPSSSSQDKKSIADDLNINTEDEKEPETQSDNGEDKPKGKKSPLQKMFDILPPGSKDPNRKLYLLLLIITSDVDNQEDENTFKFIKGRQEVYDYIKGELEAGVNLDCMKSLVLVDSPKISISKGVSVYSFMNDMRERGNVIDVSSFDIEDYFYEVDEEAEQD